MLHIFIFVIWISTHANGTKMCVLQPMKWIDAMNKCQSLGGFASNNFYTSPKVLSHLNSTLWTSDYATLTPAFGQSNPYWCQYTTLAANGQFDAIKIGDCNADRHYMCCDHGYRINGLCVKKGTWQQAISCTDYHTYSEFHNDLPLGDYWMNVSFSFQNFTFSANKWNSPNVYRCGLLEVNGIFKFVHDCSAEHYSVCHIINYPERGLSECISTIHTSTTQSVSVTPLAVGPGHVTVDQSLSTTPDSNLGIGLGVGIGLFGLIATIIGAVVYIRRNAHSSEVKHARGKARTTMNATYGVTDNLVDLTQESSYPSETKREHSYDVPDHRNNSSPVVYEEIRTDIYSVATTSYEHSVYGKNTAKTKKTPNSLSDHLQSAKHDMVPDSNAVMNSIYFTSTDNGERHEYCNTDVMSDEYGCVHFPEVPEHLAFNEYSHVGNDDENNYNVASCTPKHQISYLSDYDRLK